MGKVPNASTDIPPQFLAYLETRPEIVAAYLFGSVAAGSAHKFSDVDVPLLLTEGVGWQMKWDIILEAMGAAEAAFQRRADVVVLNASPPAFCYLVLRHGRRIFDRGLSLRAEFEAGVYAAYFDLRPYLEEYDRAMFDRIRERGMGYGYTKAARATEKAR